MRIPRVDVLEYFEENICLWILFSSFLSLKGVLPPCPRAGVSPWCASMEEAARSRSAVGFLGPVTTESITTVTYSALALCNSKLGCTVPQLLF